MLISYSFSVFPYTSYKHRENDGDKVFLPHEQVFYKYHKTFSSISFYFFINLNLELNIQLMKISSEIKTKAKKLFEGGMVGKELETDKRIHFKVRGESEEHSVIFEKRSRKFLCDCAYFTLKGKYCSHVEAVKLFLRKKFLW
ncbi:MAG: hypothetical protein QW423_00095 [Candidatus Aenigmatarchaeota archaeon]